MEIKRQDRRNTGHEYFQYYIQETDDIRNWLINKEYKKFHLVREWCWQTWGASKELTEWIEDETSQWKQPPPCHNQYWCWQNDEYKRRIYLRTDKEVLMFKLRWE